jgi:branched-chain amino acid transport system ATP-binding protein
VILVLENISKSFGERKLFENLSLELEPGKIYSLMGANGSGKTTLFNIITGFVKADSGKILFNNNNLNTLSSININKLGISRTFQDLRLINSLSVFENILLVLDKKMFHFSSDKEKSIAKQVIERVSLSNYTDNLGSDLSYGQQKLLTLGCCIASDPKLILLDEPIAGIDIENQKKIEQIMIVLRNEGKTILQIEHNLEYINSITDYVFLIEDKSIKTLPAAY